MKRYIDRNGNFWDGISIVIDNMRVFNPSDEQLVAAGYTEYAEPEPAEDEVLENLKQQKIFSIMEYDSSANVNSFTIQIKNGDTIIQEFDTWLDRETRSDYKNSLDAAELLGRTEVKPVFNGIEINLSIQLAKTALAQVQLYANQCYGVTQQHIASVKSLQTIQEVNQYDFTKGYPDKLIFEIQKD